MQCILTFSLLRDFVFVAVTTENPASQRNFLDNNLLLLCGPLVADSAVKNVHGSFICENFEE